MLRQATARDAAFVGTLWTTPDNTRFIVAPETDEIEAKTATGDLLIWTTAGHPAGFATLTQWFPRVWTIPAVAVQDRRAGTGLAMMQAVLDEMFHVRDAHRVGLDVTADNMAALSLFRRLGFVTEGVWRQCWCRPDGGWVDCVFLALLKHEWRAAA
ncbi:MAG: GNAT family N-acetyltransferase [Rhodobacter sp.]|nr:GNAT family N-acetyltransferase [Rhodobacter sp.]